MKVPKVIAVVRFLIIILWCLVIYIFWHKNMPGMAVVNVAIVSVIFIAAIILSFIRSKWSLWILAFLWTAVPLLFWLLFNTSGIVHGAWWEWLIIFPAQMLIPVSLTYTLLTDQKIRTYFHWRISNQ